MIEKLRPEHAAVRRQDVETALVLLRERRDNGCFWAIRVLETVLAGYDPRPSLGIHPKPGTVPGPQGQQRWTAVLYWKLEPEIGHKRAKHAAAKASGYTEAVAYKHACRYREQALSVQNDPTMTVENIAWVLKMNVETASEAGS